MNVWGLTNSRHSSSSVHLGFEGMWIWVKFRILMLYGGCESWILEMRPALERSKKMSRTTV